MSVLQHIEFLTDSLQIWHKLSLAWEGVSHAMTFDLDLYLQGYLAVTLPISWIIFMCDTNTIYGGDDVSPTISSRSKVKVTQVLLVFAVSTLLMLYWPWWSLPGDFLVMIHETVIINIQGF